MGTQEAEVVGEDVRWSPGEGESKTAAMCGRADGPHQCLCQVQDESAAMFVFLGPLSQQSKAKGDAQMSFKSSFISAVMVLKIERVLFGWVYSLFDTVPPFFICFFVR